MKYEIMPNIDSTEKWISICSAYSYTSEITLWIIMLLFY